MSWVLADTVCSIPERFAVQVRANPEKQAIAGTDWEPTFAELDWAANRLAAELLERGAKRRERIALLMRHDAPLMAAQLAALKVGAVVIVLHPSDPPARLRRLREDTSPSLLVTDEEHRVLALRAGFPHAAIVVSADRPDATTHAAPTTAIEPDDLAVLMCTSGSTGRPVAVAQSHRNILHNVLRHTNGLGLRGDDRIVLLASPSGGQGTGTVWTTLLNGATLLPFPVVERGMTGLAEWLESNGVTVFISSASLFRHFLATLGERRLAEIRLVRLGSEQALSGDHAGWRRHFSPSCTFANTYSSSETGAIAQALMGAEAEPRSGRLPAGHAAEGVEVLVLGEGGVELASGETGEIVVRGRHISPGYWGEEALTDARFETESNGVRRFRTGDLGCRGADGLLSVLGRSDNLVKVRGNRVSLMEVETALASLPAVAGAAVLAGETPRGEMHLTAYVAATPLISVAELRGQLRRTLPDHSVPGAFVFVEQLPLTPHGKIDRHKLEQMDTQQSATVNTPGPEVPPTRPMPTGETEELIAELWARVLDREGVGREQDFFELGGDSLAAAEVAVGIGEALGVQVGMQAFARRPTIAGLAELAARLRAAAKGEQESPLQHAPEGTPQPASFAQERIWRHCQVAEEAPGWVIAASATLDGQLDVEILRVGLERLLRRHPAAMRTRFPEREGQVLQVIDPPIALELPVYDLSATADPTEAAFALLRELALEPFDLERGPLLRLSLVKLSEEEHLLFRVCHHITCDAPSWRIFLTELGELYEAELRGEAPPLAEELPFTYGDVAAWQRERMRPGGAQHRAVLDRWRDVPVERATAPPFRRPVPVEGVAPSDGVIRWGLPAAVADGLASVGREAGATFYMVRMALYAALLAEETGDPGLIFGTYVTTRRQAETLGMFGCFTQAAGVRLAAPAVEATVGNWLAEVRSAVLDVNEHTELPHETLMEELAREGVVLPGLETVFALAEYRQPVRFAGLELGPAQRSTEHYMPAGFVFQVNRLFELDDCRIEFDANVYDPAQVKAFIARYQRLAGGFCGELDRPLGELVKSSAEEPGSSAGRGGALGRWLKRGRS